VQVLARELLGGLLALEQALDVAGHARERLHLSLRVLFGERAAFTAERDREQVKRRELVEATPISGPARV